MVLALSSTGDCQLGLVSLLLRSLGEIRALRATNRHFMVRMCWMSGESCCASDYSNRTSPISTTFTESHGRRPDVQIKTFTSLLRACDTVSAERSRCGPRSVYVVSHPLIFVEMPFLSEPCVDVEVHSPLNTPPRSSLYWQTASGPGTSGYRTPNTGRQLTRNSTATTTKRIQLSLYQHPLPASQARYQEVLHTHLRLHSPVPRALTFRRAAIPPPR